MDAPGVPQPTIGQFCAKVCGWVRFWPDHDAITAELTAHLSPQSPEEPVRLSQLFSLLPGSVRLDPDGGSTAWDALVGGGADSLGAALAFQLLAGELNVGAALVEGTLDGEAHFWNQLTADGGAHYVDLTRDADGTTYSPQDLLALGYLWDGAPEI